MKPDRVHRYQCFFCKTSIEKLLKFERVKCPVCGKVMFYQHTVMRTEIEPKGGDSKP